MATESFGLPFEVGTLSAWLVWILPFAAAMIIPGVGKLSKHATGYVAVAFALMSALSAATMIPAMPNGTMNPASMIGKIPIIVARNITNKIRTFFLILH